MPDRLVNVHSDFGSRQSSAKQVGKSLPWPSRRRLGQKTCRTYAYVLSSAKEREYGVIASSFQAAKLACATHWSIAPSSLSKQGRSTASAPGAVGTIRATPGR